MAHQVSESNPEDRLGPDEAVDPARRGAPDGPAALRELAQTALELQHEAQGLLEIIAFFQPRRAEDPEWTSRFEPPAPPP